MRETLGYTAQLAIRGVSRAFIEKKVRAACPHGSLGLGPGFPGSRAGASKGAILVASHPLFPLLAHFFPSLFTPFESRPAPSGLQPLVTCGIEHLKCG